MFVYFIRYVFVFLFFVSLSACIAQPQESSFIGECKQLKVKHQLIEGRSGGYSGERMLVVSDNVQIGRMKPIAEIEPGTRVKINQIIKDSDGSYGAYLRVEVEILDGVYKGALADVSACVPYHPKLKWVESCTLNANEITFNNELVEVCL